MKLQRITVGLAAAALAVGLTPVWAQDRGRPANSETVGSATPRGGDSGSATSSSASSPGASSSTGSPAGSNAGSATSWMGGGASRVESPRAPVRPERAEAADQRRGGNGTSSGHAVPRGESGTRTGGNSASPSASSGSESQPSQGRSRAVPTYSRPRDGRNAVGTAVERTGPVPDRNGGRSNGYYGRGYVYDPYYASYYDPFYSNRYSFWSPFGYGYGLGYFSYDPFLFGGYGYPGSYGGGYGYPGSYAGGYDPYYSGGGGSAGYSSAYRGSGSLRLKVKPENAQVYVDGYYVGVIDSFDGVFQRLGIDGGPHRVELRAEGYEPVQFDVMVTPGDTVTYKGEMKRR